MSSHAPIRRRGRAHARIRRGMYLLPSLFTACNIGAGYYSITQTIEAISNNAPMHLNWAAIAILFAIPFDALDGRIARMTNTCSDFGRELDSLADVITFGMAPSLLAFVWGFHFLPDTMNVALRGHLLKAGAFFCFLYLIGGASRLARFNISHDAQPHNPGLPGRKYFVGMPIPAAAGLLAACVHFFNGYPVEAWWVAIPWLILVGLSGFLMVSKWRFWSGKEINLSRSHPFQLLLVLALVLYVMIRFSDVALFVTALVYMFSGIWARAVYSWRRRLRHPEPAAAPLPKPPAPEPDPATRS
ncbi:MAG TPA: phosphatidylcholine/phosphatidylserine synthase [Terracidiphilus sp.]|nr:phosphatidylcholine/phosphatidylserine synthase [Terracidiphilus sp.]